MHVLRSLVFYFVFYVGSAGYVLAALLSVPVSPRWVRAVSDAWSGFHRWCVEHLLGIEVRVEGELLSEPALYAIKHESFFEAIDSLTLLDYPAGFAKQELFEIPGWGRVARAYGAIPVARDEGAKALRFMLTEIRRFVSHGRPVVIWPEGTRVPHGTRPALRPGFAGIYKLVGLPVVPVAVNSGPAYHRLWKRPGTITYRFGETIPAGLPREEIETRVIDAINALNA